MNNNKPAHLVKHPFILLGTLMLNSVTVTLDSTIANVALPHMQGGLATTQDQISWVLTSYIVATAICLPLTGILTKRLGRRTFMMGCMFGFMIASMLCGAATSLTQMVFFRILQGAFGACLPAIGQVVLVDCYPPKEHGKMMSFWGFGAMIGPVLGPTLGGYLTEMLNWRWIFYVNVPICLLSLSCMAISVPQTARDRHSKFDYFGYGALALALATFQLMLDRGHSQNWFDSQEILIEAGIAAVSFYVFVVHILTATEPFLKPVMFRDVNLLMALVLMFMSQLVLMASSALLPTYLQQLMHIPVDTTGFLMMPRGIGSMIGMLVCSRLINKLPARYLLTAGFAIVATVAHLQTQFNLYVSPRTIQWISLLQGFGFSFTFAPLTAIAFSTLAPTLRSDGSSTGILVRNLGASVGVSILFSRIAHDTQANHELLGQNITNYIDNAALPHYWQWQSASGAMLLNEEITRQAASIAYLNAFTFMMWCTIVTIPICMVIGRSRRGRTGPAIEPTAALHAEPLH